MAPKKTTTKTPGGARVKNVRSSAAKSKLKSAAAVKTKEPARPKIRVGKINSRLSGRESGAVVDLKKHFGESSESMLSERPAYASDIYDDDLAKGEADALDQDAADDSLDDLGELLTEEERLNYETLPAASTARKSPPSVGRTFGVYKKLAVGFTLLTVVVGLVVAYFLLVKVKISLQLNDQLVKGEAVVNVYDRAQDFTLPEASLRGLIKKLELEESKTFPVSGSEVIGEEVSGKMTLFNKYIKNQPLVATTRLLAADGKLFRLKNSVNVPAGGELVVEVYADQPRPDLQVGNERFSIPGLWEGLQDKIYAESKAGDIAYKQRVKGAVSRADIEAAIKEVREVLVLRAKTEMNNTYTDYDRQLYQIDEAGLSSHVDAKEGEEKEQITVKLKGTILAVAFSNEGLLELLKNKVAASLPAIKQLTALDQNNFQYELTKVDADNKIAEVKVNYSGQAAVTSLNSVLDKNKLTDLNRRQLDDYLRSIKEIKIYRADFFPPFIGKTPSLVDKITVEVLK